VEEGTARSKDVVQRLWIEVRSAALLSAVGSLAIIVADLRLSFLPCPPLLLSSLTGTPNPKRTKTVQEELLPEEEEEPTPPRRPRPE
jgi:hypothetical protein